MARVRDSRGVTLVELMVVVAVIGLLAALFLSRYAEARRDAAEARALDLLNQLRQAVTVYEARTGAYPTAAMTTPGSHWDAWVAQVEGAVGSLQLPRWAQASAVVAAASFGAGTFGDPYGMGIQPATGRPTWFRATPYQVWRCPNAPWNTAGCTPIQ